MKEKLLFLMGNYDCCQAKNAVAATLAWLCEESGQLFETYYDVYRAGRHYCGEPFRFKDGNVPWGNYFGSTVIGGAQHEQFYFLNNYFETQYVILGDKVLFDASIRAFDRPVLSRNDGYASLYRKVFEYFVHKIPETATMLGVGVTENLMFGYDALCYPEIFYSRTLGIDDSISVKELKELRRLGVKKLRAVYSRPEAIQAAEAAGFEVEIVDNLEDGMTYGPLSIRIAERWREHADQVSISDPVLASTWAAWFCRNHCIPLFDFDFSKIYDKVVEIAHSKGQRCIFGRQNSDQDILKLSRENLVIQIIDPNRPQFPVMQCVKFPWVHCSNSYAEKTPDDETLKQYAREGKVLATLLFHAGDVRHADIIPRLFDLAALYKLKMGIGITAHWYQYVPEMLELIYTPIESGGLFPYVEPLMYTGGLGICAEGDGYINLDVLKRNILDAEALIRRVAGKKQLPKGYYTFLDIPLRNYHRGRPELYSMIADLGYDYMISSMNPGECEIQYRKDDFIALNMSPPYFGFYSNFVRANDLNEISVCEDRCVEFNRPGWLVAALDSPVWGFETSPWECGDEMRKIAEYMVSTGNTGKLVNATPNTIARYARILHDMSLVPLNTEY